MDARRASVHVVPVLSHAEIVAHIQRLVDEGEPQVDIARVLGLDPPRVTEILKGDRKVKLDEAKTLADHYKIDPSAGPAREPVSEAVARLMVLHVLSETGSTADDALVAALAQDFRAFSQFVSDPSRRWKPELIEGLFAGRRTLRQEGRV